MANNRDSSKQKRARQNRAQREAREARAKAASVPASERQAKYASSSPSASSGDAAPRKKGGLFGGGGDAADRPARKPRPGDVPVDIDTLEGNWYSKRMAVPGGRQVLTGTVLTIILTVLTLLTPVPTADKNDPKDATESIFNVLGAATIPVVAVPLLAMFIASWFILSRHRRRIWIACAVVSVLGVSLLGIQYMFPVGFLVYAGMRANKVEGPSPTSRAGRALARSEAAAAGDGDGDLEVDELVDDVDTDDAGADGTTAGRDADR